MTAGTSCHVADLQLPGQVMCTTPVCSAVSVWVRMRVMVLNTIWEGLPLWSLKS